MMEAEMSEREGTGQRRMRIERGAHQLRVACTAHGSLSEDLQSRIDALALWPTPTRGHVCSHARNIVALMSCRIARTLAESGPGGRKSATIEEWREWSDLGKPAEQLLRTLCAMGQMSRVKKRVKGGGPRKRWHYGFFDALSYYRRVPHDEWPTRDGVTVDADELQRYGGAWDVGEREWVDQLDGYFADGGGPVDNLDHRTLAVGIACGRYVVNDDGTVSLALTGWGATSAPVGEVGGEPVYPTGETDDATGLPLLSIDPPADPDRARAAVSVGEGLTGAIHAPAFPYFDADLFVWLGGLGENRGWWKFSRGVVDGDDAWVHGDGDPHEWYIRPGSDVVHDTAGTIVGRVRNHNMRETAPTPEQIDAERTVATLSEMWGVPVAEVIHTAGVLRDSVNSAAGVMDEHGPPHASDILAHRASAIVWRVRNLVEDAERWRRDRGEWRSVADAAIGEIESGASTKGLDNAAAVAHCAVVIRQGFTTLARERDEWRRAMRSAAEVILEEGDYASAENDPVMLAADVRYVFDHIEQSRTEWRERSQSQFREAVATDAARFTPAELRCIVEALPGWAHAQSNSAEIARADGVPFVQHIENVANAHAALARAYRLLNPAD